MGFTIRIRLRDPEHYVGETLYLDQKALEWVNAKIVLDGSCLHDETVCDKCVGDWANDWQIHPDDLIMLNELVSNF